MCVYCVIRFLRWVVFLRFIWLFIVVVRIMSVSFVGFFFVLRVYLFGIIGGIWMSVFISVLSVGRVFGSWVY